MQGGFQMNFFIKLFHCFFCWKVKISSAKEICEADVVIGQSFGLRKDSPGISNEALAEIARKLHKRYNFPLVLQWEISDCLPDLPKADIVREHRIKGKYLDTYEMIFQAKRLCAQKGWGKAIILAHPDHYWRCMMTAKNLDFEIITVDTSSVPYDKFSKQSWTRSAMHFIPREVIARLIYLFFNKL